MNNLNGNVTIEEKVKNFRSERADLVKQGELRSFNLQDEGGKILFHTIPTDAFNYGRNIFSKQKKHNFRHLIPLDNQCTKYYYDYDGYITLLRMPGSENVVSYSKLFHTGIVEYVDCFTLQKNPDGKVIAGYSYEERLINKLGQIMSLFRDFNIDSPFFVVLSLLDVLDYRIAWREGYQQAHPINVEDLFIPGIQCANYEADPPKVLKSIFDIVWNSAGWPRSQNYDKNEVWISRQS